MRLGLLVAPVLTAVLSVAVVAMIIGMIALGQTATTAQATNQPAVDAAAGGVPVVPNQSTVPLWPPPGHLPDGRIDVSQVPDYMKPYLPPPPAGGPATLGPEYKNPPLIKHQAALDYERQRQQQQQQPVAP